MIHFKRLSFREGSQSRPLSEKDFYIFDLEAQTPAPSRANNHPNRKILGLFPSPSSAVDSIILTGLTGTGLILLFCYQFSENGDRLMDALMWVGMGVTLNYWQNNFRQNRREG